jgi:ankyrin repeat protein
MDDIFELIKNKNFIELENILNNNNNNNINLDIYDKNYNYLIHYLINYNQINLIKIILKHNIRLDILDTDGRTILFYPIKYNYNEILDLFLDYNKNIIGISIIDIKDNLGNTALHYAVIFNNIYIIKKLIEYNADPLIINNDYDNVFQLSIKYDRNDILEYLIDKNVPLNFISSTGETFLQIAISYQNYNICKLILNKKKCLINNQEKEYGLSALHQISIQSNIELTREIINNGANINLQDYYGNTPLIYIIYENNLDFINFFISYDINYNLTNIDGNTPLHVILIDNYNIDQKIFNKIIINTDLTIQNNLGKTCIHLLLEKNIFIDYLDILETKELNIFIKDNNNIDCYDIIIKKKNKKYIFDIVINSYYNLLKKNNMKWSKEKITKYIKNKKIIPTINNSIITINNGTIIDNNTINNNVITLDNGILVNFCSYTGSTIDILFGLIFLYSQFKKEELNILINDPLIKNDLLLDYYKKIGINFNYKLDFINFEIIWSFQTIFFPVNFEESMNKLIKKSKFIIIPIGIETSNGSHANIIFYDVKNKLIERFDPNGANEPINMNYNSILLDKLILNKFNKIDEYIKYRSPNKFLPVIGFQIIETFNNKCKKIGDPNGFCGIWCIWWIYQKMKNYKIDSSKLSIDLIKQIKYENINFKDLIRNFSKNVTNIRDTFLQKYKLNINDWISEKYNDELLIKINNDICNNYTKF